MAENLKRKAARQGSLSPIVLKLYDELSNSEQELVPSPQPVKLNQYPREFNMMFETHVGAPRDASSKCYLRPELLREFSLTLKTLLIREG